MADEDFDMTMLELGLQDDDFSQKIDNDFDYSFALMLQELDDNAAKENQEKQQLHPVKASEEKSKTKPCSIVDSEWEILDPNPDIFALFQKFNYDYFWGSLETVEVRWSPRMTLCAGLCCYEGRGGLCSVRLSQPLLKFRPRRDLVETLLHEMIHAYLFVTHNNKDHDAHGPEFLKHMNRINSETGARITVYHSFHNEVDHQRQHWWKCNGPCQHRRPYYGLVKRAMNRAPSARDLWWSTHQAHCGGVFTKIKEPKDYGVKKSLKQKVPQQQNSLKSDSAHIQNFFPKVPTKSKEPVSTNVKSKNSNKFNNNIPHSASQTSAIPAAEKVQGPNIHTMSSPVKKEKPFIPFSGTGYKLGASVSENAKKYPIKTSNQNMPKLGNTSLYQNTPYRESDSKAKATTSTPWKFQGPSSAKDSKVSRGNSSFGATRTAGKGGSRTVVLNKKGTKLDNVKTQETELKTTSFSGKGHVLGDSSTPGNRKKDQTPKNLPQQLERQRSLDDFLSKKPSKRSVVIFSSDSEDEGTASKVERKDSSNENTSSDVPYNADRFDGSPPSSSHAVNFVQCPVCSKHVRNNEINSHLDRCLGTC